MRIVYRLTDDVPGPKKRPEWFAKTTCLNNFLGVFAHESWSVQDTWIFVADRVSPEFAHRYRRLIDNWLGVYRWVDIQATNGSDAFLHALRHAMAGHDPIEVVYLVEDDYLHCPNSRTLLHEGLTYGDFVSLYDHPDKYTAGCMCRDLTWLAVGATSHWRQTPSTTMTFAGHRQTFGPVAGLLETACKNTSAPPDNAVFRAMYKHLGMSVVTPIPGFASHCETQWLAPLVNWEEIASWDRPAPEFLR